MLFAHQASKGALEPVFIHMMRGFDCCKLVIKRAIGSGQKAFGMDWRAGGEGCFRNLKFVKVL